MTAVSIEKEHLLKRKQVYDGKMLHVYYDDVEIAGRKAWREVVLHPGATAILAVTDQKEVLLVRQYRYAIERPLLELPAGKIDPGEEADACAARELTEETGYRAGNLVRIGKTYTTPGFCNETIYLYLADHLIPAEQHLDPDEYLDVLPIPLNEMRERICRGEIEDAKTLAAFSVASSLLWDHA